MGVPTFIMRKLGDFDFMVKARSVSINNLEGKKQRNVCPEKFSSHLLNGDVTRKAAKF